MHTYSRQAPTPGAAPSKHRGRSEVGLLRISMSRQPILLNENGCHAVDRRHMEGDARYKKPWGARIQTPRVHWKSMPLSRHLDDCAVSQRHGQYAGEVAFAVFDDCRTDFPRATHALPSTALCCVIDFRRRLRANGSAHQRDVYPEHHPTRRADSSDGSWPSRSRLPPVPRHRWRLEHVL